MKIHITDNIKMQDLQYFTELFLGIPYFNQHIYNELQKIANWWNEGLFTKLFFNQPILQNVSIEECDIVGIPFKYSPNDDRIVNICNQAQKYNKRVVTFYNDDYTGNFELPSNLYLFRTSAFKSKLKNNERIFPVFVPDHSSINNILNLPCNKNSIGFCGHQEGIRSKILNNVLDIMGENNCDFIIRSTFYHNTNQVNIKTRREYCNNIANNLFTLCIRGAGNFSYRFYESLCMGRIPILINTDNALPFEKIINWNNYIIKIDQDNLHDLPELINNCKIKPENVRKLWEDYFSPEGYTKNFYNDM